MLLKEFKPKVFVMPDQIKFVGVPSLPTLQFIPQKERVEKYKEFTVSHSPRNRMKQDKKGANVIREAVKSLGMRFELITGKSVQEAIQIKGKSHVHVDQIVNMADGYKGGIGKSGLEAIMMGCAVITSGDRHKFCPPVIYTKDLKKDLLKIKDTWEKRVEMQDKWFSKFNTIENFQNYFK